MSDAEKTPEKDQVCQTPPVSEETKPETTRIVKAGPSVKTYIPKTMDLDEFKKLPLTQQKKLMKHELWVQRADELKEIKKQKKKQVRKRRNQRQAQEAAETGMSRCSLKRQKLETQENSNIGLVLDMAFDDKMDEKEIKSISSQVMRCYSANRQAAKRVNLHMTKLHGKLRERFDTAMPHHVGWSSDHVQMHEKEYLELFDKSDLVYLTADSPNVIESLEPGKLYVIGGIVDKNRYPRLTLNKAEEQGIAHAQLPIAKYVKMSTRKIMTVNQIFEMLLKFIETNDWKTAFMDVIPQRKFKNEDEEPIKGDEASAEDSSDSSADD
ncbi:tRNA (guanine(9)-N(1))-methyltransferase [Coemansia sp. RSA 485]|nr:tRNA (guanine(9)-N(1))-methyltransferase [Coemansia sp. RSA 485]